MEQTPTRTREQKKEHTKSGKSDHIPEQRKNEQNQPDLRGAFSKITEFSLEEAIQWEKEVEEIERKME